MVLDIGVGIEGYTEVELDGIPSGVTGRMRSSQERFIKAQGILSYFALGFYRKPLIKALRRRLQTKSCCTCGCSKS
jgi:hypothetical protein